MRIILDTDKKTVTVPWNYMEKLEAMNKIIVEATGDESKKKTFDGYLRECWDEAMFKTYVDLFGPITKEDALRMFETNVETSYDIEYAY